MAKSAVTFLLLVGLSLSSLYVFPSGYPQPADFFLAAAAAAILVWRYRLCIRLVRRIPPIRVFVIFTFYSFAIAAGWYFALDDLSVLRSPLYYGYNLAISLGVLALVAHDPRYWYGVLRLGVTMAVIVAIAGLVTGFNGGLMRQTGTFNNPNQLGYFAILALCIHALVSRRVPGSRYAVLLITLACSGLVIMSMSITAAAGIGAVLMGITIMYRKDSVYLRGLAALLVVVILFGTTVAASPYGSYAKLQWERRIDRLEHKADDVGDQRGYTRIVANPHHLLLGAGEGAFWRFGSGQVLEIHSSAGTLVFSYGVVGAAMLLTILGLVARQSGLGSGLIASGPLIYALTHNGMRSTYFWLFLVLLVAGTPRVRSMLLASHRSQVQTYDSRFR